MRLVNLAATLVLLLGTAHADDARVEVPEVLWPGFLSTAPIDVDLPAGYALTALDARGRAQVDAYRAARDARAAAQRAGEAKQAERLRAAERAPRRKALAALRKTRRGPLEELALGVLVLEARRDPGERPPADAATVEDLERSAAAAPDQASALRYALGVLHLDAGRAEAASEAFARAVADADLIADAPARFWKAKLARDAHARALVAARRFGDALAALGPPATNPSFQDHAERAWIAFLAGDCAQAAALIDDLHLRGRHTSDGGILEFTGRWPALRDMMVECRAAGGKERLAAREDEDEVERAATSWRGVAAETDPAAAALHACYVEARRARPAPPRLRVSVRAGKVATVVDDATGAPSTDAPALRACVEPRLKDAPTIDVVIAPRADR